MAKQTESEETRLATFRACMQELGGAHGREVSDAGARAYWRVLGHMDSKRMREAFERAMAEERFWPSPATVRAYARMPEPEKQQAKPAAPWTAEQMAEAREMTQKLFRHLGGE